MKTLTTLILCLILSSCTGAFRIKMEAEAAAQIREESEKE